MGERDPWWRHAVIYEIYVRSFADSDGDGIGDLAGIRARLPEVAALGADGVWITPFYPSPMADHGYDVSDHRDVDPRFGTLADADALILDAHRLELRLVIDLVPNHTSNRHPWFQNALRDPDHPDRSKYLFRDPAPGGGPPNNWASVFGGPAWTLDEASGQYYLHLFAPEQPDLNWRNPEVRADFLHTIRFWLDRGVDGLRIDVAHGLIKDEAFRDEPGRPDAPVPGTEYQGLSQSYAFDQPEVHEIYRSWRRLAGGYPGDRLLLGEVYLYDPRRVAPYLRPDELHLAFNFLFLAQPWDATRMRWAIDWSREALGDVGAPGSWVVASHDVARAVTRLGGGEVGRRRARAAALLLLALPGAAFLYQGEELGLEDVELPDELRQDPIFHRRGGEHKGRDGCRVPIPWSGDAPGFGFTTGRPWLPMPAEWARSTVALQRDEPGSMWQLYQRALELRRGSDALQRGAFTWLESDPDVLRFERRGDGGLVCAVNVSEEPHDAPQPGRLLLASDDAVRLEGGRLHLPAGTAAWIATDTGAGRWGGTESLT